AGTSSTRPTPTSARAGTGTAAHASPPCSGSTDATEPRPRGWRPMAMEATSNDPLDGLTVPMLDAVIALTHADLTWCSTQEARATWNAINTLLDRRNQLTHRATQP